MKKTEKHIKLDWHKLLGFSHAKAAPGGPDAKRTRSMIGTKVLAGIKAGSPGM